MLQEVMMTLLNVMSLKKVYTTRFKQNQVLALNEISFKVETGEYVAIMGESGSGKTTLLNLLATLDKPTSGTIILSDLDVNKIKDKDLTAFRRDNLGFVFQEFNLLDTFSIKDNILLPLVLKNTPVTELDKRLMPLVKALKIEHLLNKFPYEVSGGEKQRTAVARALINSPKILLADEPTGSLDSKATDQLLQIFSEVNKNGQTVLMVTHSILAASKANRILFIKDGNIFYQLYREQKNDHELYQAIASVLTRLSNEDENV